MDYLADLRRPELAVLGALLCGVLGLVTGACIGIEANNDVWHRWTVAHAACPPAATAAIAIDGSLVCVLDANPRVRP